MMVSDCQYSIGIKVKVKNASNSVLLAHTHYSFQWRWFIFSKIIDDIDGSRPPPTQMAFESKAKVDNTYSGLLNIIMQT